MIPRTRVPGATVIAVVLVAACAGTPRNTEQPAPPAKATEPPHLSIVVDRDNHYDATGSAFVQFDPSQGMLAVFVFDPKTVPQPSCETLALASLNLESGGFAAIRLRGYDRKTTGTYPITGGGFIAGNVRTHETRMASSGPEASNLVITTFDDSHFVAEAVSDASAEMQVHGSISATVCSDGALGAAGQPPQTSPTDFDAGVEIDAAPPPKPAKKKRHKQHGH